MERERKDRSANWMLEHHAGSLLRLSGITNFTACRAASGVIAYPKRIPDGLIDVTFADRVEVVPFLLEIESYPYSDCLRQIREDAAIVLLSRGVLPDILLVVVAPKGNLIVPSEQMIVSACGTTELALRMRVLNLWMIPADVLLGANDVGLIPWVPLAQTKMPPSALPQICKERIENDAKPSEKGNLLAATRVMAEMKYMIWSY